MGLASRAREDIFGTGSLVTALLVIFFLSASTADAANLVDQGASPPPLTKKSRSTAVASPATAHPASEEGYWTKGRMLSAQPVDNSSPASSVDVPDLGSDASASAATGDFTPGNVTAFPQRIHGKIFFRIGEGNFTCSGTVVESALRNVVYTAGHCVFDQETGSFVADLAFVPGYENGTAPYGIYYGYQWFTTQQWAAGGSNSYDIGLVTLQQPIEDLGARKIAFDLNPMIGQKTRREYTIYGYPSLPSTLFDGEVLRGCRAAFRSYDSTPPNVEPYPMAARPCLMQQGASGGGWITLGNYLSSVVSYGYCDNIPSTCGTLFGPVFSNAAKGLYTDQRVGGSPRPTIQVVKAPPRVIRKRSVSVRFGGAFSTLPGFLYKLDRQSPVYLSPKILLRRLRPGKHTLRVRAVDQTGKLSKKQVVRKFRVVLKKKRR